MDRCRRLSTNQLSASFIYTMIIILSVSLLTTVALLIWYLFTPTYSDHRSIVCPPNPCQPTTTTIISSTESSIIPSSLSSISQTSTSIFSTGSITNGKKSTYKEACHHLYDCYTEYGLLCLYGWNENQSCLCEGSHYWSVQQNKCLRKGELNDTCDTDYQCHREIGFVCDKLPDRLTKICICAATIYWAKDSNCGQTILHRIVDCIDEIHATTCLVLGMNSVYHMLTIRSLTQRELSFDWFLIDNRMLFDLPRLSCSFNNETRYCFDLSIQDSQHSLKLAQFTQKGFHSIEDLGGLNHGTAFGLTDANSVSVYVRNNQNILYRRVIVDDEVLPVHNIAPSVTSDPTCYIQELEMTRQLYCFARNEMYGLNEYAELSINTWQLTQLGYASDRIRNETIPVCSYVGRVHRYCFVIFENGQIYRILYNSNGWSTWQVIGKEQQQFVSEPVFLTSKLSNESNSDQTCYLIAIDTNYQLQISTNLNCAVSDNFSTWIPIETNRKFKQFDKTFRLRDGNIGVLGIDDENRAHYIYLDPATNRFTLPQPAFTVKPIQFRP
ncbi:hypothetical protein I4U23_003152 [Adineta vaga]|nr:hypothetical protein I4U23_003152 [Adineta vaga]